MSSEHLPAWRALVDRLPDAAWLAERRTGRLLHVNEAGARLLGEPAAELLGRDVTGWVDSLEDAAWWAEAAAAPTDPLWSQVGLAAWPGQPQAGPGRWERRLACLDGGAGVSGDGGAVLVLLRDITREQRESRELEVLVAELRATLEATADGILVTDLNGRIRAFNRRFASLWGIPDDVLHAEHDQAVHDWMRRHVADGAQYVRRLEELLASGEREACDRLALLSGDMLERRLKVQQARGVAIGRVYSFRPVSPVAANAGHLRRVADRGVTSGAGEDSVTGLPDRPRLLRHIDEALDAVRRGGGSLAVMCLDLGLAQLPTAGAADDTLLRDIAQAVRGCVRQPDVVARTAGMRLAVLVHHLGEQGAETLARRMMGAVSRRVVSDALPTGVPMTIGAAMYPEAGTTAFELLAHAEQALGEAGPARGGNAAFRLYRPGHDLRQMGDRGIELALREALDGGRLRVAFQPVVELAGQRMVGAEALLRWRGTEWGDVPPGRFLPVARAGGMMPALDRLALRAAVDQAVLWRTAGRACAVSVNQSAQEMLHPGYVQRLASVLQSQGLPAGMLEIEFAEDVITSDPDTAGAVLADLHRLGVSLTLDDFGVGLSAIGHLRDLPLRQVKLARPLLRDVADMHSRRRMLAALLALAEALGVRVVAKGVENERQCDVLRGLEVKFAQGFLFAGAQAPQRLLQRLGAAA